MATTTRKKRESKARIETITAWPSNDRAYHQYSAAQEWIRRRNIEMAHLCFEDARRMVSVTCDFKLAVRIFQSMVLTWLYIGVLPPKIWFKSRTLQHALDPYSGLVTAYMFGESIDMECVRKSATEHGIADLYEQLLSFYASSSSSSFSKYSTMSLIL